MAPTLSSGASKSMPKTHADPALLRPCFATLTNVSAGYKTPTFFHAGLPLWQLAGGRREADCAHRVRVCPSHRCRFLSFAPFAPPGFEKHAMSLPLEKPLDFVVYFAYC